MVLEVKIELKTLKDINSGFHIEESKENIEFELKVRLKQEAIKWMKELEKDRIPVIGSKEINFGIFAITGIKDVPLTKKEKSQNEYNEQTYGAINWIKDFFNITEEDLKKVA